MATAPNPFAISSATCRKPTGGEEFLQAPVKRLGFRRGVRMAVEPDDRNGALSNDRQNQHQKTVQAGFGQPKVWLEMFAEGLHSGFDGSESRKSCLTPDDLRLRVAILL